MLVRKINLIGCSANIFKSEVPFISSSHRCFVKTCHCSRPIRDCTHVVLIFHLCLFLSFSTTERPRAGNTSAICNYLSNIFSIRSSYMKKLSVVSESGVKMVRNAALFMVW